MDQKRCLGCMEVYDASYTVCPHCGYVEGTPADEAVHMEPGTILEGRYVIGRVLGYGGFGATYIAWDPVLEQKVAIKEYLPSEFSTRMPGVATVTVFGGDRSEQFHEGMEKFVEEAKRLSKFQNEPGIVKIFDSFQANSTAYIVMEYLDGETLTSYLEREGKVPEEQVLSMLMPVMQSLQVVHEEGLLHRDIAPDNIFVTKEGNVKLIDFGASRYATTSHSRSLTVIIKPGYSPEEQYRSHGDQGPHTDVYSLAAVMYKMLTGVTPPDALERRAMIEMKNKELLKDIHKLHKDISPSVQNAILNALNIQIADRTPDIPTFTEELLATKPVKRRYGKIKKIDIYGWPLWIKIVVPAVMVAALVTIGLLVTDIIKVPSAYSDEVHIPEGMVIVPDVEGMDKDDAISEITKAGLLPSAEGNVSSAYVEAGKIVLQNPYGGNYLIKNGKVVLTVSSGGGISDVVDGMATVPYVIWDTQSNAIAKLLAAGLSEPIIETAYDDNVAEGNVISQSVEAGTTVAENTAITITVSLGAKPFDMPNVVNMTKGNAEAMLNEKGLVVTFNYVEDYSVPENTVLAQDIPGGQSVKKGMTVQLKVSSQKAVISVANVTGMQKDTASATLKKQGFAVTVLESYSETVEKGLVISQTPVGGTGQQAGANVTIIVSKGVEMITVPNVVGKTQSQASTTLQSAGFGVSITKEYSSTVASGNVIRQTPESGTSQEKGATITLTISTGVEVVTVPNVVGQTKANAVSALESAGFVVSVTQEHSNTVPAGNVINQTPDAGTSQEKGATITLTISTGVEVVTVPNVVGQTQANATSALQSAGFTVATTTEYSDTVPAGNIISQSIAGGQQAAKGSVITVAVSLGASNATPESYFTTSVSDDKVTITGFDANYDGDVVIPETIGGKPVAKIDSLAFDSCCLTSVTIPDSVISIDDLAFLYCEQLTSVTIGKGVTSIGMDAFTDCTKLNNILVDANNPVYSNDARGVLFDKDKTTLIRAPEGLSGNYDISNRVISIDPYAFRKCTSLTSVTIPDSVTSIGEGAFRDSSLTSVTIGKGVTSIEMDAFSSCGITSVTIPDSVTSIGSSAFSYCEELTSVTIGKGVTSIGMYAFSGCGITSVTIPDSVTSIGANVFSYCKELTSVTIPDTVTDIGYCAFCKCTSLTSVTIPDSVNWIGDYAFSGCTSLTSVTIGDRVTSIGDEAFGSCTSLTSVTIPDSVTDIGEDAFYGCTSLTSVTIGDRVTSIGEDAFYGCTSLTTVYFYSAAQKNKFANMFDANAELIVLNG